MAVLSKPTKPCSQEAVSVSGGLPEVYYTLHALLQTLRALESHQDQICSLLADIQRSGKVNASVRKELANVVNELPTAALDSELRAVWAAME